MNEEENIARTVLIIDDSRTDAEFIQEELSQHGYYHLWAHSGEEGLTKLEKLELEGNPNKVIDAVILDLKLQGIGGYEVLTEIHRKYSDIPVIMVSGHVNTDSIVQLKNLGAASVLLKDVENRYLDNIVETVRRQTFVTKRKLAETGQINRNILLVGNKGNEVYDSFYENRPSHTFFCNNKLDTLKTLRTHEVGVAIINKLTNKNELNVEEIIKEFYPYVSIISEIATGEDISVREKDVGKSNFYFTNKDFGRDKPSRKEFEKKIIAGFEIRDKKLKRLMEGMPSPYGVYGPGASGKNTLIDATLRAFPLSIAINSDVSRPMRPEEIQGYPHYFKTKEELEKSDTYYSFLNKVGDLEYLIGFKKGSIEEKISKGKDALFVLRNESVMEGMRDAYPTMKIVRLKSHAYTIKNRLTRERGLSGNNLMEATKENERVIKYKKVQIFDIADPNIDQYSENVNDLEKELSIAQMARQFRIFIERNRYINY